MKLPIKIGDIVEIAEADYCYGAGTLKLRITGLPPERLPDGSDWIYIRGMEINWNGQELGERVVLVRTAALKPHKP